MSGNHGGVCGDLLQAYRVNQLIPGISDNVGVGEAAFGIAYLCNAALMLFWIHRQRQKALLGVDGAAMYVIFPVYIPFMYMSFFSDVTVGMLTLFMPIDYWGANSWPMAISAATIYALQHFVLEGIAFTMMQYGCGYQAAYRAMLFAFIWGSFTFIDQLIVRRQGPTDEAYLVDMVWNVSLLLFYLALWLVPEKFMFRRPSVVFYSKFWAIFRFIDIVGISLAIYWSSVTAGAGYCTIAFGNMIIFLLCKPYVIYHTLLADSLWWQGLGQQRPNKPSMSSEDSGSNTHSTNSGNDQNRPSDSDNDPLSSSPMLSSPVVVDAMIDAEAGHVIPGYLSSILQFNDTTSATSSAVKKRSVSNTYKRRTYRALSNPLLGMEVGFADAQELAQEVDNLRSEGHVRLLNFAYLSLKKSAPLLGSGSFSKVYAGEYRGQPVAIKMLFTPDLNPEVIRRCCNEAQLLSKIQHPNIVTIYGVAVLPPSVCIVLEKCEFGSLADVLRGCEGNVNGNMKMKAPLPLTLADRMFLALGCCRGVAAMHQLSNEFVHRDIKSFNFLVDMQLVVKVADLELGSTSTNSTPNNANPSAPFNSFRSSMMMSSWQAPEVIGGEEYQQAADVYSLAVVLWEIIASSSSNPSSSHHTSSSSNSHGNHYKGAILSSSSSYHDHTSSSHHHHTSSSWQLLPYGECESQHQVRQKIMNGERPLIPHGFSSKYTDMIIRGWQTIAHLRPSALEMSCMMETCWHDVVHHHIRETSYIVDENIIHHACRSLSTSSSSMISSSSKKKFSPPSPSLLSALSIMQQDERWLSLEDEGAYVITTSTPPYCIVWATRLWCKLTGYLLNEVLSCNLSSLLIPSSSSSYDRSSSSNDKSSSDRLLFEAVLDDASVGVSSHCVYRQYRVKDRSSFYNSVHAFPIYASSYASSSSSGRGNHHTTLSPIHQAVPFGEKMMIPDDDHDDVNDDHINDHTSLLPSSSSQIISDDASSSSAIIGRESATPRNTVALSSPSPSISSPFTQFLGSLRLSTASSATPRTTSSAHSFVSSLRSHSMCDKNKSSSSSSDAHHHNATTHHNSKDSMVAYIAVQCSALKNLK